MVNARTSVAGSGDRSAAFRRVEAAIYDAAIDPDHWETALQLLTRATDAAGAAIIVRDNRTNSVQRVDLVGPAAAFASSYVDYYAALDRFMVVVRRSPANRLLRLSDSVPQSDLRTDEWYNDFVLKCGVGDIVSARIHDSGSHTVILGLQQGIGSAPFTAENSATLGQLLKPIGRAVRLQQQMNELGWRSSIALRSLDHLAAGVVVSDIEGRVIEMNVTGEHIMSQNDGLTVRHGRLTAGRAFESGKLTALLAAAATTGDGAGIGRMPVGRPSGKPPYLLTVAPLGADFSAYGQPAVLTLVIDPDARRPTLGHLTELFGLSPAEGRVAIALMSGKMLRDVAFDLGVEVATLRTQLSSIFRKVGVKRQADLVHILTSIPVGDPGELG